ncbi:MAG: acyl carrier protein [Schwartzia succinivorans]|uniref:acyl carrier protein n=1 Tax=Schwartzia succinivorans TaxID=55507 RepID=UPI00235218B3|nr:acyl carrier protein [Schwartzia succinivorans]MBE6096538.1 acyl carrier protein [Schwartzia succinivorans]
MTDEKKLEMIADVLEVETDEITKNTVLADVETWDSVAILSFISIMNDEFNKFPNANEIRAYATVGDLMNAMG